MKRNKCFCDDFPVSQCGDCDQVEFHFNDQEVEDILSALSFFVDEYPTQAGAVATKRAMKKLTKKIWDMKKEAKRLREGE